MFCRLRARTESLAERLNRAGIPAAAYHAGLNREERSRVVQAYLSGRIRVVTATSAFGMGVDIPDIRLILHDHLPTNMIDYVQQSGRAGRDGETAYALLLFSPADLLRFHTRCHECMALCRREAPGQFDAGNGHVVSCHLYGGASR